MPDEMIFWPSDIYKSTDASRYSSTDMLEDKSSMIIETCAKYLLASSGEKKLESKINPSPRSVPSCCVQVEGYDILTPYVAFSYSNH